MRFSAFFFFSGIKEQFNGVKLMALKKHNLLCIPSPCLKIYYFNIESNPSRGEVMRNK